MSLKAVFTSRSTPWVGGSLLLVLAAVLLYFFTGVASSEPSRAPAAGAGDISFGPDDARVAVIEYSDFECPFCAEYAKMLTTLRETYGDRVKFVYRFFPLSNHPYATISAKVAYAAWKQGRFWEMHDLLFARQKEWSGSSDPRPLFDTYAKSLGLDMRQFHADADSQAATDFITNQADEGSRAGVSHTPWFIVDGRVVLPRSLGEFEKLIEDAL